MAGKGPTPADGIAMEHKLERGQYYGTILRRLDLGSMVLAETRHPAGARIPPHAHRNAYFCFVQEGAYFETFGPRSRECGPLTVAFHTPDETHSERMTGADVRSLNVEVTADWLQRVQELAPALREPFDCRGGPAAWLAARLYREFRWGDAASRLTIEGLLLEIAAELSRAAAPYATAPAWLRRARDLLRDRFREDVSPTDLGREVGIHPVHLASVFRKHLGCSVGEFVRNCRVEFAATRLACRGVPLADIAAEAGFADQSHFTRLFKRATGLTPAAFRRSIADD
jgi:AraC family transcriptional regulator